MLVKRSAPLAPATAIFGTLRPFFPLENSRAYPVRPRAAVRLFWRSAESILSKLKSLA